jgi:hypothetical protein
VNPQSTGKDLETNSPPFYNTSGALVTSVVQPDGAIYFFDSIGASAVGTTAIVEEFIEE